MASCSVATICTISLVWPVAWLLLFQTPGEGQRSVMLRSCCESPRQPLLLWADPNSCCHARLLWRHREDWEPSNRAKFLHLPRRSRQYTKSGAWRLACPMVSQHTFDSFQIPTRPLVTWIFSAHCRQVLNKCCHFKVVVLVSRLFLPSLALFYLR